MAKNKEYKKIARGGNISGRARLYIAKDHLLYIEGSYVENYRRFYFNDIKSLSYYRKTPAGLLIAVAILAILTLITLSTGGYGWLIWGVPAAIIFLYMLFISALGGFCNFRITTDVQDTSLNCIGTMRKAKKIAAIIQENVEPYQVDREHAETSTV